MLLVNYLSGSTFVSNIGRRLDTYMVRQRWNVFRPLNDHGFPSASGPKFCLRVKAQEKFSAGIVVDSNRSYASNYTDVLVSFDDDVQDAALSVGAPANGHGITVDGTSWTSTYRSGSGTARWVLRLPLAVAANGTLLYSYDPASGNTTSVSLGTELAAVANQPIANLASRRIRFTLHDSAGALVGSQTVKLAIFKYAAGSLASDSWMHPELRLTTTTDSSGVIDIPYTGTAHSGDTVYVGLIRPDSSPAESLIWTLAVA